MAKAPQVESILANPSWTKAQQKGFKKIKDAMDIVLSYQAGEIPVLDNHSDAQLVDEVGYVKAAKKVVEKAEKAHTERLKARMGNKKTLDGETFIARVRSSTRTALNQGAVKELLTAFDEEGIDLHKLLKAIQDGEVTAPKCILDEGTTNTATFHPSTDVGALYVEEI